MGALAFLVLIIADYEMDAGVDRLSKMKLLSTLDADPNLKLISERIHALETLGNQFGEASPFVPPMCQSGARRFSVRGYHRRSGNGEFGLEIKFPKFGSGRIRSRTMPGLFTGSAGPPRPI
jgi:hypothetical protein